MMIQQPKGLTNLKSDNWQRRKGKLKQGCKACSGCTLDIFVYDDNRDRAYGSLIDGAGFDLPLRNVLIDLYKRDGTYVKSARTDNGKTFPQRAGHVIFKRVPEGEFYIRINPSNDEVDIQSALYNHILPTDPGYFINTVGCDGGETINVSYGFYLDETPLILSDLNACAATPSSCYHRSGACNITSGTIDGNGAAAGGIFKFYLYVYGTNPICNVSFHPVKHWDISKELTNHIFYLDTYSECYLSNPNMNVFNNCTHKHYNPITKICNTLYNQHCRYTDFYSIINYYSSPEEICGVIHIDYSGYSLYTQAYGLLKWDGETPDLMQLAFYGRIKFFPSRIGNYYIEAYVRIPTGYRKFRFSIQRYTMT